MVDTDLTALMSKKLRVVESLRLTDYVKRQHHDIDVALVVAEIFGDIRQRDFGPVEDELVHDFDENNRFKVLRPETGWRQVMHLYRPTGGSFERPVRMFNVSSRLRVFPDLIDKGIAATRTLSVLFIEE